MAAESDRVLDSQLDRLSITSEESYTRPWGEQECSKYDEDFVRKWGFPLRQLYRLALAFYKEKEGKAIQFSYKEKLKLVAFTKQVSIGRVDASNTPPVGVLDVIGRDRRLAWQALGDMPAEDAMANFVDFLDAHCPIFRPYAEAHKADIENRRRLRREEEARHKEEEERRRLETELRRREDEERERQEVIKRQIQEALNQQTLAQFQAYASHQFPNSPQQQEALVEQLQERHYEQYMEQVVESYLGRVGGETGQGGPAAGSLPCNGDALHTDQSDQDEPVSPGSVKMATMWTRKDVKDFKESIRKEGGDAVITVGHGETVTVRVPTNNEGTCLFWEFATDYYDIGFGVYFEWSKSPTSQVSVHVSESEDEDDYINDDDEDDDDEYRGGDDLERGVKVERAPLSIIVPVYRRDSHDEVYAGSHRYPGEGVYLLKFDNSYSLWRSKTLYYRVYYTR